MAYGCSRAGTTLALGLAACVGACGSSNFSSSGSGGNAGSSGSSAGGSSAGGSGGASAGGSGGASAGGSGGAGTAGSGGAGAGGSGGAAGAAGAKVDCSKQPIVFPDFVRACFGGSASCGIVSHQIDCCGTRIVTGVNHSQETLYKAAEKLCESQYPPCGCNSQQTKTDTGQTVTDVSQVQVKCVNNVCTTYIP